ncbi:MAG: amidohydrolase [Rhodothermales bacterium]
MHSSPVLSIPSAHTDEGFHDLLIELRRHLHQYPEVGFREHETSRYLRACLETYGFEIHGPLAGTGFYLDIEGAHPGPTVAYRTELDALPMQDAKTCAYASTVANMAHLCGHDAHMAVAVGVALLLDERRDALYGTARILFQPNEESTPSGAPRMMADGVLDARPGQRDGAVREIFCIHVDSSLDVGRFGLRTGAITAATAPWEVRITSGGSGHSARPYETVDTVWLATQILNTFYQLPGRIHDARRTAVLTACRFRAGEALNVIPSEVEFGGTLRCVDFDALHFLADKMQAVAEEMGALYDAQIQFDIDDNLPPVVNDAALVETVRDLIVEQHGKAAVHTIPEPSMGGEDFAFYAQEIPGMLLRVGTRSGKETSYPLHHALFDVTEEALPAAAHLMADVIAQRLSIGG